MNTQTLSKKHYYLLFCLLLGGLTIHAQDDIFFSEYVEDGRNKCLELFNPTEETIDLSAYTIEVYSNGSSSPVGTPWSFVGRSIGPMSVIVLCQGLSDINLLSIRDYPFGFGNFNGDDAILLKNNGRVIDIIGKVGCDPGTSWFGGGNKTEDVVLVRNACVNRGITNSGGGCSTFNGLANDWTSFSKTDYSHLGNHNFGLVEVEIFGKNALCEQTEIILTATEGFRTYRWSNGSNSRETRVTQPGTYTVTVTTTENCIAEESKTINGESPEIFAEISNIKDVSCLPKSDGGFSVSPSGGDGSGIFTYEWETGSSTSATITGVAAGDYNVTVMDNNGCSVVKEVTIGGTTTFSMNTFTSGETCKGRGDGTINVSAAGNGIQYSLDGENFQNNGFFDDVLPGRYNVLAIDNSGCGNQEQVTVDGGTRFDLRNSFITQAKCQGEGQGGQIFLVPNGGRAPYFVSFDGGPFINSDFVHSNLQGDTFDIIIRDGSGCEKAFEQIIDAGSDLVVTGYDLTPATCEGINDGGLDIQIENGTGHISYSIWITEGVQRWKPGPMPRKDLPVGKHSFLVRDSFDCRIPIDIEIIAESPVSTEIVTDISCGDDQKGRITVLPQTGIAPYQYSLDTGAFGDTNTFLDLDPNTYVVTTKDSIGCVKVDSVNFEAAASFEIQLATPTAESCANHGDGRITVFTNNTNLVEYRLNDGDYVDNPVFSGLTAGDYTVYAKSGACTDSTMVTVLPAAPMVLLDVVPQLALCEGDDGQLTISVSGGQQPYEYKLGDGAYQANNVFANLTQGSYTLTVRDANLCEQTFTDVTLAGPVRLDADCSVIQHVSTKDGNDGVAQVAVFGGASPYNIQLVDAGFNNILSLSGVESFNNLSEGTYTVEITDNNGCKTTCNFTIEAPQCDFSIDNTKSNATCFERLDGTISLVLPTANMPFTINWSDTQYNGQQHISGLSAGDYRVTVSDQAGCTDSLMVTITQPAALSVEITADNLTICEKDSAQLMLTDSYTQYNWSNGNTSPTTKVGEAGTYQVTVRNSAGCIAVDDIAINVIPQDTMIDTRLTCDESSIGTFTVEERGVDGCMDIVFRTFELARRDTTALTRTTCNPSEAGVTRAVFNNAFGCDSLVITTTNLLRSDTTYQTAISCNSDEVGFSNVVLTNAVGCDSMLIIETILDDVLPQSSLAAFTCNLSEVGVDTFFLKTLTGCDSLLITTTSLLRSDTTYQTAISCNSDEVGFSNVVLTNAVGCDSMLIIETILDDVLPQSSLAAFTCNLSEVGVDTSFLKTLTGCDSLLITMTSLLRSDTTYQTETSCNVNELGIRREILMNAVGCDSTLVIETTLDASFDQSILTAFTCNPIEVGIDTNFLKTFAGCDSLVITQTISNASVPINLTATTCIDTDVNIDTLFLTNQFLCDSLVVINTTLAPSDFVPLVEQSCNPLDTGLVIQNLINQFGCDSTVETMTTLIPINSCQLGFALTPDTICWDASEGTIQLAITEGIPPFDYYILNDFWRDTIQQGVITTDGVTTLNGIPVGQYSIVLVNDRRVSSEERIQVVQAADIVLEPVFSDYAGFAISCEGETDGSIDLNITGGEAPYTYLWADGTTTANLQNLAAGNYQVTVTDVNGCQQNATFDLSSATELQIDFQSFSPVCFGDVAGKLTIFDLPNANGAVEYSLDGVLFQPIGALPFSIENLTPTDYQLFVQDENDCQASTEFSVPVPIDNQLTLGDAKNLILGDSLTLIPKANFEIDRVEWSATVPLSCEDCLEIKTIPTQNGTYTLTAYDANGCKATASTAVNLRKERQVYLPNAFSPNGDGNNDVYQVMTGNIVSQLKKLEIFDYEGRLMYQVVNRPPNDAAVGWDGSFNGQEMLPGVFVVFAEVELLDGTNKTYRQTMTLVK